ncbi:MAG: FixH family protein [Rhizobiales bacterium]|nr:FixH family protein [Hyphomicrobiales bacterium]
MRAQPRPIEGKHVLAGMVAFFGVIIGVNVTMAVLANTSWTGLAVENGYVASQHFNAELAEARRQAELGWKPRLGYGDDRLELALEDSSGRPLSGFAIEAELERPSTDREDRRIVFNETSPGLYIAEGRLNSGQWDADVTVKDGAGRTMRRIYRFVVQAGD